MAQGKMTDEENQILISFYHQNPICEVVLIQIIETR